MNKKGATPLDYSGRIYHFDRDYGLTTPRFGDVLLYQVGELYAEEGFSNGGHQQWCYEITYIESGVGTVVSNGRTCVAHAGDIIVTGKDCYHEIISDQGSRLRFLYLGFDVAKDQQEASPTPKSCIFSTTPRTCACPTASASAI